MGYNPTDEELKEAFRMWSETLKETGFCGSYMALGPGGEIKPRPLTTSEILALKDLYDDFEELPPEFTIT